MRYAVHDRNGWPLAMLGFSTAAWKLAPRDRFVGWMPRLREKNLPPRGRQPEVPHPALDRDPQPRLAHPCHRPPEPERDGVCAWTRADLCRWLEERFAKTYHPSSMTRVLRRMGFSRQKARPSHPRRDAEAQERFKKGELYI